MLERKIEIIVALRNEILVVRPYFITPVFDRPEERIREGMLEFDIRGNYKRRRDLKRPSDNHTLIYLAFFKDEEE